MKQLDLICRVDENGRIELDRSANIREYLQLWCERKCRVRIGHPTRTTNQNAYLHAIFSAISVATLEAGQPVTAEALKEYFKRKYGPTSELTMPDGEVVYAPKSTAEYNSGTMTEFIECIRDDQLIKDLRLYIETPEEWLERRAA